MRATHLEVDVSQFYENIKIIKEYVNGKEIMPVIKANAYGTYLNRNMDVLSHFPIVAVALVQEGVDLREDGYEGDIFILNQPSIGDIEDIVNYHLTVGLSDLTFLEECIEKEASFPIHLEIETGMNRTGLNVEQIDQFLDLLSHSNLTLEGLYSHFSSADYDQAYTSMQIDIFEDAYLKLKEKGYTFKYVHMAASNGLINYSLPFTNLVRPGILIYGYESYPGALDDVEVKPICTLKTEITFLKEVPAGTAIGYSQNYVCEKDSMIATIPIGYADGYRRSLSNKGKVYINGKCVPIVGSVCMDSCMVDVTGLSCRVGNPVFVMDNENITLESIAKDCDTINYEILCTISERVPRLFVGGEDE